jgi:hypothetical protein
MALSGFVIMFHSDDYIPLLLPCFDIPMSLGHMVQWIAPIDDRGDLPGFNELIQKKQVLILQYRNMRAPLLTHERDPD